MVKKNHSTSQQQKTKTPTKQNKKKMPFSYLVRPDYEEGIQPQMSGKGAFDPVLGCGAWGSVW